MKTVPQFIKYTGTPVVVPYLPSELTRLKSAKEELNMLRHDNRRKMQTNLLGKIKRNGGVNSKEFWKAARGDLRTTPINSLKNKDGSLTDSVESTVKRAAEYFNDLFESKVASKKKIKSVNKKTKSGENKLIILCKKTPTQF